MAQIYPKPETRQSLEVFCMMAGEGEFFDLPTKPITREQFRIGKDADKIRKPERAAGYFITDRCIGCGTCVGICPQNCIRSTAIPYVTGEKHCLHCGNCYRECPAEAVVRE